MICGGCGRTGSFRESRDVEIDGAIQRISWCCKRGLHFGIWIIACGRPYSAPTPTSDHPSRLLKRFRNAKIFAFEELRETYHLSEDDSIIPKGVGYSPYCSTFIPSFVSEYNFCISTHLGISLLCMPNVQICYRHRLADFADSFPLSFGGCP